MMDPVVLLAGGGLAGAGLSQVRNLVEWGRRRASSSVWLSGEPYRAVAQRLERTLSDPSVAFGEAWPGISGPPVPVDCEDEPREEAPRLAPGTRWVKIEGVRCLLDISREKFDRTWIETATITTARRNAGWLKSFVTESVRLMRDERVKGLNVYTPEGEWWRLACTRPWRPLDTIDHPTNAPAQILEAIEEWRSQESVYVARGENWHIGFLLKGPPGTGKTSTAIAIASELRLPLYVLTPKLGQSVSLEALLSRVPGRCVLLVEECDELFVERTPDGKKNTEVAAALSYFDGPLSRHGVIRLYTTNHPDRLDPSFLRAGRCDHHFEFPARVSA